MIEDIEIFDKEGNDLASQFFIKATDNNGKVGLIPVTITESTQCKYFKEVNEEPIQLPSPSDTDEQYLLSFVTRKNDEEKELASTIVNKLRKAFNRKF